MKGPAMLKEILRSLSDSFTSDLLSKKEELDMVSTQLREEKKFLKVLVADEGEDFNEFSPRTAGRENQGRIADTRQKVDELDALKKSLTAAIESLQVKSTKVHEARLELKALEEAAGFSAEGGKSGFQTDFTDRMEEDFLPDADPAPSENHPAQVDVKEYRQEMTDLMPRLRNIESYLPADPMRAKVELQDVLRKQDNLHKNVKGPSGQSS